MNHEPQEKEQRLDLLLYWEMVWKRKWLVVAVAALSVVYAYYRGIKAKPIYEATATVMVNYGPSTDILGSQPLFWYNYRPEVANQIEVVRSRQLAEVVAENLPEEVVRFFGNPADRRKLAGVIKGSISVRSAKESDVLRISARAGSPGIARALVNSFIDTYQEYNLAERRSEVSAARLFIEEQLRAVGGALESEEDSIQSFKERNKLVSLDDQTRSVVGSLTALEAQRQQAVIDRQEAEKSLAYVTALIESEKTGMSAKLEDISSPVITSLKTNLNQLEVEKSNLLVQGFAPDNPRIKALDAQIAEVRGKLRTEAEALVARGGVIDPVGRLKTLFDQAFELGLKIEGLRARESVLARSIRDKEREIARLPAAERTYANLTRAAEVDRKIYTMMSERRAEARIAEAGRLSNIRIVDYAMGAGRVDERLSRKMMFGLFVGMLLGIGLCFVIEYLDTSVRSQRDMERLTGVPILASVPNLSRRRRRFFFQRPLEDDLPSHLMTHADPRSSGAESFRRLRTSLQYLSPDAPLRTLGVTSPGPREGKSTCSVNIATVLAQTGASVLLVDADLRRPALHRVFGAERVPGLSDFVLTGGRIFDYARKTQVEHLLFMTSGTTPPSPPDLFNSRAMDAALQAMEKEFRYVVVDTAPVLAVSDTQILGPKLNAFVVVARFGRTRRDALASATEVLNGVGTKVVGSIVNGVGISRRYGYYYYYDRYGYDDAARSPARRVIERIVRPFRPRSSRR